MEKGTVSIIFPKQAVAVIGHEFNMYYTNVISCVNLSNYDVCCTLSPNPDRRFNKENTLVLSDCFRITPPEGSEGEYTLSLSLNDKITGQPIVSGSLTLRILADKLEHPKKVLFLGDSLTNAGIFPAEIQYNLSDGKLISLGTRKNTVKLNDIDLVVSHEGRSSWSAFDYTETVKTDEYKGAVNAFYNPATDKFDFTYYMNEQGYDGVDVVCINLGTNGVWAANKTCTAIDEIIASIHAYNKSIKIVVSLIAIGSTQDGFALSTGLDSANSFRRNAVALIRKYIEKYDGTTENVYVSENYFCLDEINDYDTALIPFSARNPGTRAVPSNNVHPNLYGYLKFADVCYNNILRCLAEE